MVLGTSRIIAPENQNGMWIESQVGISRDPFHEVAENERDDIALGAACYLLRGYANFFRRHRIDRNFDAAKLALNDFYQAYQLSWRLYHTLECNHHKTSKDGLEDYLDKVLCPPSTHETPGETPYFVWSLILLCEIMRGNIYRQIDYLDEAERHYRNANKRLVRLFRRYPEASVPSKKESLWHDTERMKCVVSPTAIRAVFERSKVQFDLGWMLESVASQTRCLQYIVVVSSDQDMHKDLKDRLKSIVKFIDAERTQPIYERRRVIERFRDLMAEGGVSEVGEASRSTHRCLMSLRQRIRVEYGPLVAEILSRLGFTLFTLRPRSLTGNCDPQSENWLRSYFRFDEDWNRGADDLSRIKASPLGRYCETLLLEPEREDNTLKKAPPRDGVIPAEIERRFALLLRQFVQKCRAESNASGDSQEQNERNFYREILSSTTQNIGNIVTIPRRNARLLMRSGYKNRRSHGDLSERTVYLGYTSDEIEKCDRDAVIRERKTKTFLQSRPLDKFVVLRRWQSFNPKIPRPGARWLKGGGYFLLWKGKGIVIDPGYDFIQNFYDEGFSLEDIDAIVLSHSHPDHDDDFASLTTLVKEWNEYHEKLGQGARDRREKSGKNSSNGRSPSAGKTIRLDLFLNESTHWKFAAWLQATKVKIGRVVSLPVVRWNKDSERSEEGPNRGKNVAIDLRSQRDRSKSIQDCYNMIIEVIPAWHDDVISKTAAIGLKFHLYDGRDLVGVVGYTGDTGAYGLNIRSQEQDPGELCVADQYKDCDVLVAHLGDIKMRELATAMGSRGDPWCVNGERHPLAKLLRDWFVSADKTNFRSRVTEFLDFAITLDLFPSAALGATFEVADAGGETSVRNWLGSYLERTQVSLFHGDQDFVERMLQRVLTTVDQTIDGQTRVPIKVEFLRTCAALPGGVREVDRFAYLLLCFLVACATMPYKYHYHLGIFGLHRIFSSMLNHWTAQSDRFAKRYGSMLSRVFVVGELPEELTSYRHLVAHKLNETCRVLSRAAGNRELIRAFTGDIGLHIGLVRNNDSRRLDPKIRCTFCNYNNEMVLKGMHYHDPSTVRELAVKRLDSAMVYLCKCNGHHPAWKDDIMHQFLSSPPLRVI
jgi:ribonuclease BN (tRNA processing enzyme)